jgi:pimeloyl-ACP methyl ester carboxylesterase
MGGAIAAAFAAQYPERLLKVALVCPAGRLSWVGKAASALPFLAWKIAVPPILLGKMKRSFEGVAKFRASVVDDTRDERGASNSSDGSSSSMFSRDDAREERLFALIFPRTESFESDRSIEDLH